MTDPKKPALDPNEALLAFAEDYEQTVEEARAELKDAGVDVDGFLVRLQQKLKEREEEERLSWLRNGRERAAARRARPATRRDYGAFDRAALEKMVEQRHVAGQRVGGFRRLEELTDDDLRSLLQDLDEEEEGAPEEP